MHAKTTNPVQPSIYGQTEAELRQWVTEQGEPAFRSRQIWHWLYVKRVASFAEMSDLTLAMRGLLSAHFSLAPLKETYTQRSKDGTRKYLLELTDGNAIETVLMEHTYGLSLCVTTQVGCNIGCSFCASGLLPKKRNLTAGEITAQLLFVQQQLDAASTPKRISHVVVMGIGEPFDNYAQVLRFAQIANHPKGLSIGARHITVSTSGLVPKIKAFAHEALQLNLAISLHAPNDPLRTQLMKINKAFPVAALMEAVDYYLAHTNRKVTFEYLLIKGLNDLASCAFELANLILSGNRRHLIHVNLIPYNPVRDFDRYQRSEPQAIHRFASILRAQGISAVVRGTHGSDIDAACGQLRSKHAVGKSL